MNEVRQQRISRHVTATGAVIVPPRIAHWMEAKAKITADWRNSLYDTDREAYDILLALHMAAMRHISGIGSKPVAGHGGREQSDVWLSTKQAGDVMGVTDRCVRQRINAGRLPATLFGSRWLINRNDIAACKLTA